MLIPRALILGIVAATLCNGSPSPSPSPRPQRRALQLEPRTSEHPAAASIRGQRFLTVDELKAYIDKLPPETAIRIRWWTDSAYKENPFFIARDELRKFCVARGRNFDVEPAPFW